VTIRCALSSGGSSRASAESTARSGHDSRGLPTRRRSTATSCRRTKISAFFAASVSPSPSDGRPPRAAADEPGSALDEVIEDLEAALDEERTASGSPIRRAVLRVSHGAYRRRAAGPEDRAAAVDAGLTALSEDTAAVLLGDATADIPRSAHSVADLARRLAIACLEDDDAEAAMTALELGRGFLAAAVTCTSGTPGLLLAAGHPDLADEWQRRSPAGQGPSSGTAAPNDPPPNELRERMLAALTHSPTDRGMLRPPTPAQVAQALRAADRDALVYLLSGEADRSGWVLVVTARGSLRSIELPGLRLDVDGALVHWIDATDPTAVLDDICTWARAAVLEPVLATFPDRKPRLILVPCDPLGTVPWDACLINPFPSRVRARKRAVLSYAATARQFVELAGGPPPTADHAPTLVPDPGPDYRKAGCDPRRFWTCLSGRVPARRPGRPGRLPGANCRPYVAMRVR
jgi:hypothetical protein